MNKKKIISTILACAMLPFGCAEEVTERYCFFEFRQSFCLELFDNFLSLIFSHILLTKKFDKNASNIPNNAPQITSDGKCTYRYSLVKHIKAARIIAGIPNFLLYSKITVAAENEDIA